MKIIERTHNIETGEIVDIERDETAAETKARLDRLAKIATEQAEAEAKAAKRATAEAKLAALGLTTDELKALGLGGN
jgi:hypothetical protein